jgi:hypothetical protein
MYLPRGVGTKVGCGRILAHCGRERKISEVRAVAGAYFAKPYGLPYAVRGHL